MELDREDFRQWLAAKEPDEPANRLSECPLSSYMRLVLGDAEAWMGFGRFSYDASERPAPMWARKFVQRVDVGSRWARGELSAKDALTILDGIQ